MGHRKPEGAQKEIRKDSSFRREFIQFLILFFILWLSAYLLTKRIPGIFESMQVLVAREVAFCLDLIRYPFTLQGQSILFHTGHGTEVMIVIAECTGLYISMIYFAIIGAYPARIGERLLGLLIGLPAIHLLNLARMVVVSLVLYHRRELFHLFHGYLWQVVFVIFMLLLVILWMGKIVKRRGGGEEG